MTMGVLARLRLYRALSGLFVNCVSTFTQGVALGYYLPRPWRWSEIISCPERVHPEGHHKEAQGTALGQ